HNVLFFTFFLGLWAALQGIKATRGATVERTLELLLATGVSRLALVRDRALGFAVTMGLVCLGMGAGSVIGGVAAGSPDLAGSALTMVGVWGAALACYGLGLLVAQWLPSPGAATAALVVGLSALYLMGNVWELIGAAGAVRFVSPFFWASHWRALVPGASVSLPALGVLLSMAAGAWGLGAWGFSRREVSGALLHLGGRARRAPPAPVVFRPYWQSELWRTRWRLVAWSLAAAFFSALLVWLEPAVTEALLKMELVRRMFAGAGVTLEEQYLSFSVDVVLPLVGAFAATHVGAWAQELEDGRVELFLAQAAGWWRLWHQRLLVLAVGAALVCLCGVGGIALGATAVGLPVKGVGLARTGLVGVLLALAVGGLGAVALSLLRSAAAVVLVSTLLGGSYVIGYLVPMFEWPPWVGRLSLFGASGHPYLDLPQLAGGLLLAALALGGPVTAALVSRHLAVPSSAA
ncbi:MAG: hypothetical protein INH41_28535, partial [Myxococcaceae bacterium]|nr:hypothetical protein [Myxococcaceae bacterium]